MIDMVFVVDDPAKWHTSNLVHNRSHYSMLGYSGGECIARIQDHFGAEVYYNTRVRCRDMLIKYGVVKTSTLISELVNWNTLYLSGRLHKPVQVCRNTTSKILKKALWRNQLSAVYTSLLLLPEEFNEEQLFTTITGLSYSGDFRMIIGEDKGKVSNIVKPNLKYFQSKYANILETVEHIHWNASTGMIEQDKSRECLYSHLNRLPTNLIRTIVRLADNEQCKDNQTVFRKLAKDPQCCTHYVNKAVKRIVAYSSITQSVKGIFTGGIQKSIMYSLEKLKKMLKGGKRENES
ncbi:phosphatidate cytidylyltransferase, mitochondrial-like isoform X2 [Antedon mediterranea]|uniref:phosphatidate cytidylyltransferase, mitochondrial-like isoform X2 n=1 Tax=Antedon mediterranea TaxID=105859 RepID=UPI003AF94E68